MLWHAVYSFICLYNYNNLSLIWLYKCLACLFMSNTYAMLILYLSSYYIMVTYVICINLQVLFTYINHSYDLIISFILSNNLTHPNVLNAFPNAFPSKSVVISCGKTRLHNLMIVKQVSMFRILVVIWYFRFSSRLLQRERSLSFVRESKVNQVKFVIKQQKLNICSRNKRKTSSKNKAKETHLEPK